jgi:uncharacterized membrane protein HdeD (DUF308 family)
MAVVFVMALILSQALVIDYVWSNRANTREFVWAQLLSGDTPLVVNIVLGVAFCALLLILFVLSTALFIPPGQFTASKFVAFRPLPGYTINIVSSLAGILLYTWVSFLMRPRPLLWFPLAGVAALYSVLRDRWWKPVVSGTLAPAPVMRDLSVDRPKVRFEE